jgi:hypothetical protein
MEIGSDDLVLDDLVHEYIQNYVSKYHFFGICDCAWLDAETMECIRITSKATYGAGRMISRQALEVANWKIWNDRINKGLDNNSVFNMARKRIFYQRFRARDIPYVIDIKSKDNIWKFDINRGLKYDVNNILNKLSDEEKEGLECYRAKYILEGLTGR